MRADILERCPAVCSFQQRLGNTRLIPLPLRPGEGQIYAKLECDNPFGTIKARTAFGLLSAGLENVSLSELSRAVILSYSGSTLYSPLTFLTSALEIPFHLALYGRDPDSMLQGRDTRLLTVYPVSNTLPFDTTITLAEELSAAHPDWIFLHQHRSRMNVQVHRETTGAEIIQQMGGNKPDAWVAAIGTGGTLIGVYEALVCWNPALELWAVSPAEQPYGTLEPGNSLPKMSGVSGLGNGRKQPLVAPVEARITGHHLVAYPEALRVIAEFHEETGIRIGSSSAGNLIAARRVAGSLGEGSRVVTVFPSAGTPEEWRLAKREARSGR